uniref:Uncharacterized protein n=1 Tax=Anguilla anguilla TaxID=7936 RepID=A0A0E9UXK1_ANGAN
MHIEVEHANINQQTHFQCNVRPATSSDHEAWGFMKNSVQTFMHKQLRNLPGSELW